MNVQQAYNSWAQQYDTNINRTRDLEAVALRKTLDNIEFQTVLEIGCGTGKNTEWFVTKTAHVTAVDLSEEMLALAKQKVQSGNVVFQQADITTPWNFAEEKYDLISFSLILEHVENLHFIFEQAALQTAPGGHLYIGELHPFKQYGGSKARFDTDAGTQVVTCFTHNISDFTSAAKKVGFTLIDLNEYFDNDDRTTVPRILILLFQKRINCKLFQMPMLMDDVTVLYRPVGPQELDLIKQSGWTRFPPRLSEQPIFYPVLNEAYAIQIARDWNVPASGSGYVTKFHVHTDYIRKFEVQNVGGEIHDELWVPAEELDEFNNNIVGLIEVTQTFGNASV